MRRAILALLALVCLARPAAADLDPNRDVRMELRQLNEKLRTLAGKRDTIVLVTMGIGSLIWERHGHIALCVLYADPRTHQDECYNYGVADFHKPIGMAWGFFRGTHSFWVAKSPPIQMLHVYLAFDRTIYAQALTNLDDKQVQEVIAQLETDIREENKYYAYDHFVDNCTTRARDIMDRVTGGELKQLTDDSDRRTYRDLAREGFYGMRIPLLITDIAMGRSTDRVPSYWEKMFLPQYLREATEKRWGFKPVELYTRKGPPADSDGPSGRVLFGLVIILLTASSWATRLWGRFERAGLIFALVPQLILGTVLLFLAIISPLPYVRWNETCLVLVPADILLVAFLSPEKRVKYARGRVVMLVLVALLGLIGVLTQPLLAPILWPLIPCAVVGFMPSKAKPAAATKAPEARRLDGVKSKKAAELDQKDEKKPEAKAAPKPEVEKDDEEPAEKSDSDAREDAEEAAPPPKKAAASGGGGGPRRKGKKRR